MSSRASSPVDSDDDFRATMEAMAQSSPLAAVTSKRNRAAMNDDDKSDSDSEDRLPSGPVLPPTNQNIVVATKLYADKKRLRVEQATELESTLPSLREVKLFANLLAIKNDIGKLVTSKPGYEVSPDLVTNIAKYAPAVLLSSKINIYKGDAATEILLGILKKFRFDIPPGLENIPADWAKVTAAVQYALTQRRAAIKKTIRASLNPVKGKESKDVYGPPDKHQNIYDLTQVNVKGTQCTVNVVLCARIALMRKVYCKHPGTKFWDKLDDRIAKIREDANSDAKKITKAFRHILTEDQNKHGKKTEYVLDEVVDDFQQQVDDLIDVGALEAVTSADAATSA
ncbi:hypothetical protein MSAN_00236000 [Mycena sanguinolenta]|uniref:Uncharacterized protein n=1 Tax=Mycena sanguinolenta TaxID=230812 RepID=A0A8H7DLP8_9AGAR|nr:hypothetical protein MSAN_00236000 [Mycena sanguinolenta]